MKLVVIPPSPEKDSDANNEVIENNSVNKNCRYYDRGYYKYQKGCRYFHPL